MTTSRITARIASALPRLFSFTLLAALTLGVSSLSAQQSRLVGKWSGVDHGTTVTLVIRPDGHYTKIAKSGTATAEQSGGYRMADHNRIFFSAAHTAAKTLPANQTALRPPMPLNSRTTVVFQGSNRIVVTDETTHRSVAMFRVH